MVKKHLAIHFESHEIYMLTIEIGITVVYLVPLASGLSDEFRIISDSLASLIIEKLRSTSFSNVKELCTNNSSVACIYTYVYTL